MVLLPAHHPRTAIFRSRNKGDPNKMCLAIPSKIVEINGSVAVIDVDGVRRECSLLMLEDPRVGQYVIVHAGFALHTIDEEAAMESLKLLREAAALFDGGDADGGTPPAG